MRKLESIYEKIESLVVMDNLIKGRDCRVVMEKYGHDESVIVLGPSQQKWLVIRVIDDRYSLICKYFEVFDELRDLGYSTSDRPHDEATFLKFLETIFSLESF